MRQGRSYKISAIVIRRRNFLEKDRILTVFSLENGKIDILSKGARRPGSRLSYASDLGTIGEYTISKTKSIDLVAEVKTVFIPDDSFGNLQKSNRIFYALKIVDKLYHGGEAHERTYRALSDLVRSSVKEEGQLVFTVFLKTVLLDLGVKPELAHCIFCGRKINKTEEFDFNLKGGIAHSKCDTGDKLSCSMQSIKFLRLLFEEERIGSKTKVDKKVFESSYEILRLYIRWHFEDILPPETI